MDPSSTPTPSHLQRGPDRAADDLTADEVPPDELDRIQAQARHEDEQEQEQEVEEAAEQGLAKPARADQPEQEDLTPETAFRRTVEEGRRRLEKPFGAMVATGIVGGMDVVTGVLLLLLVVDATGSQLMGGLAFSVAFVALLLAGSELFTEGFLVPVSAVVARKSSVRRLLRFWSLTTITNLLGGWFLVGLVVIGFPALHELLVEEAEYFVDLGFGLRAFVLAVLAGVAMTLMTWMQNATGSVPAKIFVAIAFGFLVAGGQLYHSVLDSILMFGALHTGDAGFTYLDWALRFAFAAAGNLLGGVGLVTTLRLLQVPDRVRRERERSEV